jgi:hypothetical protein
MQDFTLAMYRNLTGSVKNNNIYTVRDYIRTRPKKGLVLRHDVDISLKKALRMAQDDYDLEVQSTYYFRYPKTFDPEILKKIEDMGHEIGYHYEVLDKTRGDVSRAIALFRQELDIFRKYVDVTTVSMHGGVLTRHDNRDIWKDADFSDFGLLGEPYISVDYTTIHYFTDTGRDWSGRYSVKDNVEQSSPYQGTVNTTPALIQALRKSESELFFITIHPKRWSSGTAEWLFELALQSIKNVGKSILKNQGQP